MHQNDHVGRRFYRFSPCLAVFVGSMLVGAWMWMLPYVLGYVHKETGSPLIWIVVFTNVLVPINGNHMLHLNLLFRRTWRHREKTL